MSFTGLFLQIFSLAENIFDFIFIFLVIVFALYVYLSFAYYAIAKKARLSSPGLAWIPFVGPSIIAYQTSEMHWWPWLLLIGFMIPFVGSVVGIVFTVFTVVWRWKMFESIGRPGWWSILMLIPIVNLILLGIAAWSKK
ncbi:hypothetical protein J4423_02585 [Candidatus Pacearchaeota archaeon]|nr:hypothetical protein [Candidatus Pacearchaeota archaeon]